MNEIPRRWEELYLNDSVVHVFLGQYRDGHRTWEEVMEDIAVYQTNRAMRAEKALIKERSGTSTVRIIVGNDD